MTSARWTVLAAVMAASFVVLLWIGDGLALAAAAMCVIALAKAMGADS